MILSDIAPGDKFLQKETLSKGKNNVLEETENLDDHATHLEVHRLKQDYDKWCERMDYLGRWAALYDCPSKMQNIGYKIYYYFTFLCCMWGMSGWIVALIYSLLEKPIPCILSWYEIHSNGQPKDLYEAIGVILLASVPAVCFIFRPASFSAGASDGMHSCEFCPTKNPATLKEMVQTVRFNVCAAWGIIIVGFIGGVTIWNVNLHNIVVQHGSFECGNDLLIVLDQIIVFPVYSVAATVVAHTVMSFAMKMTYFQNCFLQLKNDIKSAKRGQLDPYTFLKDVNEVQQNILETGKKFGMYLGVYTIVCVLCTSFFAGKIPSLVATSYKDFLLRAFYQLLFVIPNVYVLKSTASLGSNGLIVIRAFLRRTAEEVDEKILRKAKYVNQHLSLRLQVGDIGLRMYGVLLDFKFLTQLFSLWGTFLTMVYSSAQSQI